jgi:hypothetical protein
MPKLPTKFQVYNLKNNYIGTGKHSFKIVISPRFKTGQDFSVKLLDSDRNQMIYTVNYWGRKLNVDFDVIDTTPDGLAIAYVSKANEIVGNFVFWVIK